MGGERNFSVCDILTIAPLPSKFIHRKEEKKIRGPSRGHHRCCRWGRAVDPPVGIEGFLSRCVVLVGYGRTSHPSSLFIQFALQCQVFGDVFRVEFSHVIP